MYLGAVKSIVPVSITVLPEGMNFRKLGLGVDFVWINREKVISL
ncbi:MAG: hypothetical protein ACK56F_20030 [bacterium]